MSRCPNCQEYVDEKWKKTHRCSALSFRALINEHRRFWVFYMILTGATFVYLGMLWSI